MTSRTLEYGKNSAFYIEHQNSRVIPPLGPDRIRRHLFSVHRHIRALAGRPRNQLRPNSSNRKILPTPLAWAKYQKVRSNGVKPVQIRPSLARQTGHRPSNMQMTRALSFVRSIYCNVYCTSVVTTNDQKASSTPPLFRTRTQIISTASARSSTISIMVYIIVGKKNNNYRLMTRLCSNNAF